MALELECPMPWPLIFHFTACWNPAQVAQEETGLQDGRHLSERAIDPS